MSDRELLEAAAKATGEEYEIVGDRFEFLTPIGGTSGHWNPLTDDGDALRLAVKLGVEIRFGQNEVRAVYSAPWRSTEPIGSDRNAATRRAIVRAAAALSTLAVQDATPMKGQQQ